MCLAVYKNFKIEIVKEPIFVYKIGCPLLDCFTSPHYDYKYIQGELSVCPNPFEIMSRKYKEGFVVYDQAEFDNLINEFKFGDPLILWMKETFDLIVTGFHFMYSNRRITSTDYKLGIFAIPEGARVVTGIDSDLGVTDKIIYLGNSKDL